MNGTLAAVFALVSLTDMAGTDDAAKDVAQNADAPRLSFQLGQVRFQEDRIGTEIAIEVTAGTPVGSVQPTFGMSVTDDGTGWIGAGATWRRDLPYLGPLFVESTLMAGASFKGEGPDLGGPLHFRSSLGAGFTFDSGAAVIVSYDHRSNADTQRINPGLEVVSIRYAIPF